MQKLKQDIIFKLATLLLTVTLLLPSAVKFSHVFSHHEHEICYGEYQTHMHNLDLDCSFYKFKLSSQFTIPNFSFEIINTQYDFNLVKSQYLFLSEYQALHFSLRGPPQLV